MSKENNGPSSTQCMAVSIIVTCMILAIFALGGCATKQDIQHPRPYFEKSSEETKLA